jgi:hypothetical protein
MRTLQRTMFAVAVIIGVVAAGSGPVGAQQECNIADAGYFDCLAQIVGNQAGNPNPGVSSGGLPFTGSEAAPLAALGAGLVVLGAGAVTAARRQKP